jgi:hypothetical protein
VTQIANGLSTTTYSYDNDGNLTAAGTSTFSWDCIIIGGPRSVKVTGSTVYENWHSHLRGEEPEATFEYPIYSDTDGVPEVRGNLCPYQILRSRREVPSLQDCPALILRIVSHGGLHRETPEEFASLLSLLSGTRLAASSNYTRRWGFDDDPLGQPIFTHETLVVPKRALYPDTLRQVGTRRGLELPVLQAFPELSPAESLTLAKAARLYRIALWYSESQEEYCWLMLVSALETAAAFWQKGRLSAEEQLGEMRPKLREMLLSAGGVELLRAASAELADYMGATRKFINFVCTFSQEVAANTEKSEKGLKEIYAARSRALHSGAPIPSKMTMSLPEFEGVARSALIGWWKSLLNNKQTASPQSA